MTVEETNPPQKHCQNTALEIEGIKMYGISDSVILGLELYWII